ncbi:hypothetical protein GCM10026987_28550 [Belliella aquatica]|uniref:Uncharacterized protein n=2 Tax=Belliella aquatica TaxID=1323734 RepID=A0ABQ1MZU4_9BACT|nr:hypothetical protein GCM10010993_25970 [Belliella aquatica]
MRFVFSEPEILTENLKVYFYDENRKLITGNGQLIDQNGFLTINEEFIRLISYFPYPLLVKRGNANIVSVLIPSKDTFEKCLGKDKTSNFSPILRFNVDLKNNHTHIDFEKDTRVNEVNQPVELAPIKPARNLESLQVAPVSMEAIQDRRVEKENTDHVVKLPASVDRQLKGKVIESNGTSLKNIPFVIYVEEKNDTGTKDIKLQPLLSGTTDQLGTFNVKVPNKVYQAAFATVGNAVNDFLEIILEEGRFPLFTLLMSSILHNDDPVSHQDDDDCECHGSASTPTNTLPDMEDLVSGESQYQQDIGGSCVNFTTPNRALEEFTYHSVVRLSDPEVMNAPGYIESLEGKIRQLERAIEEAQKNDNLQGDTGSQLKSTGGSGRNVTLPSYFITEITNLLNLINTGNFPNFRNTQNKTRYQLLEDVFASIINNAQSREPLSPQIRTSVTNHFSSCFPEASSGKLRESQLIDYFNFTNTQSWLCVQAKLNHFITLQTNFRSSSSTSTPTPTPTANDPISPATDHSIMNLEWMQAELQRLRQTRERALSRNHLGLSRSEISIENQIQWDSPLPLVQPASIAHGHLLHFRQVWKAHGYSMGDLLYSLPLAPGQQKQIAIHDWDRRDTASRSEIQSVKESLSNSFSQDRDINEIVRSNLQENIEASSSAKTKGFSAGGGSATSAAAAVPIGGIPVNLKVGFSGGVSGGRSSASSDASQTSSRNLSASNMQSIREKTMQNASSLRSQRSTVITTVSQSETTTVTTESVGNYNHCHAITIQYFEVLRHLAVYNELVDVQECLFIPLTITLFDDAKIVRWADLLKPALRAPAYQYGKLLEGFDSVRRFYEINSLGRPSSEVYYNRPSARYCDEDIVKISGNFRIKIQFTCPTKALVPMDDALAQRYERIANGNNSMGLVNIPPSLFIDQDVDRANWRAKLGFISEIEDIRIKVNNAFDQDRERVFFEEIQKVNAIGQFAASIKIFISTPNHEEIPARISLTRRSNVRTGVRNGEPPIFDFTFTSVSNVSIAKRVDILSFGITADHADTLPDGSRLIVDHIKANYESDYLSAQLCDARPSADLTLGSVSVRTPMTESEMVSPRAEDLRNRNELLDHINSNIEYYHKAIWVQMDPDRRLMLLEGFKVEVPPRENPAYRPGNGEPQYLFGDDPNQKNMISLASVIENRLIGIAGNSLIMPVAKGHNLNPYFRNINDEVEIDGKKVSRLMLHYMPEKGFKETPFRISIPTKGVFAEAVMGACNSCEKIDNTRYWEWDKPIPNSPTAIQPVSMDSRKSENWDILKPSGMSESMISQMTPQNYALPNALAEALKNVTSKDVFNNLTGLDQNQKNAIEALKLQTNAAVEYAKTAADLAKSAEIPKNADLVAESIRRNVKDPEKAEKLVEDYYKNLIGEQKGKDSKGNNDIPKRIVDRLLGSENGGKINIKNPDGSSVSAEFPTHDAKKPSKPKEESEGSPDSANQKKSAVTDNTEDVNLNDPKIIEAREEIDSNLSQISPFLHSFLSPFITEQQDSSTGPGQSIDPNDSND